MILPAPLECSTTWRIASGSPRRPRNEAPDALRFRQTRKCRVAEPHPPRRSSGHTGRGQPSRLRFSSLADRVTGPFFCSGYCRSLDVGIGKSLFPRGFAHPAAKPVALSTKEPASWRTKRSRSEEHTSELQSLMRISYAAFFFT